MGQGARPGAGEGRQRGLPPGLRLADTGLPPGSPRPTSTPDGEGARFCGLKPRGVS